MIQRALQLQPSAGHQLAVADATTVAGHRPTYITHHTVKQES